MAHGDFNFFQNPINELQNSSKASFEISGVLVDEKKFYADYNSRTDIFENKHFFNLNFNKYRNLTKQELEYFRTNYFYDFVSQTDRLSAFPVSTQNLIDIFEYSISFFLEYFKEKKITHILFKSTPHMGIDFLLYAISKYLKVKIYILYRCYYENLFLIANDYKLNEANFIDNFNSHKINFKNKFLRESKWVERAKNINNHRYRGLKSIYLFLINVAKRIYYFYILNQPNSALYISKNKGLLSFIYLTIKHVFYVKKVRSYYNKIKMKNLSLSNSYVFFPLHHQPELTTRPQAEYFDNQIHAINYLRRFLPSKISIYIKEHPRQLNSLSSDLRQFNTRDKKFYDEIKLLKNVYFVDENFNSSTLIKNCEFVATIKGTSSWEAICLGKPSLNFSLNWHNDFEASKSIKKEDDMINFIRNYKNLNQNVIAEKQKIFLKEIEKKIFNIVVSPIEYNSLDVEEREKYKKNVKDVMDVLINE